MKRAALTFGFLLFSQTVMAAGAGLAVGKHDTDKPVTITADAQDFDLKAKTVAYKGNVIAVQGDIKLRADTMKGDQVGNKIYASGKVVVDSPASGTATGDNGVYDLTTKLVTLSGHVVLNKPGQATLRGSLLTVNMVTGKAGLTNPASTPGLPSGRVQGVFTPKSATGGN
jgi:lipopolysaccharide export system protein LptA